MHLRLPALPRLRLPHRRPRQGSSTYRRAYRAGPPAALGAPPGEETVFSRPLAPPPPPRAESIASSIPIGTDWTSYRASSTTGPDSMSTTSGAPSLREQDIPSGLRRLGEEAEALLLRYLREFYAAAPEEAPQQLPQSMLFRSGTEPDSGIPLTPDFVREYERIAKEAPPRGVTSSLGKAFPFRGTDAEKYLAPERLSPELLALGDHMRSGNPFRRRQYQDEDRRWARMADLCRSTMRLAAYTGGLANLAVQADQLAVSPEDRSLLDALFLSLSELLFKQSTRAALITTRHRRDLALSAMGFNPQQRAQLTRDMPCTGPFLFSGQFTPRIKEELAIGQQARELANQLHRAKHPGARPRGFPRPPARPPATHARRGGSAAPAPQRGRGARGSRGHSRKGKSRGKGGQSQAATGRGGF